MTEKRFNFVCDDENCFFRDGSKVLYCYEVVDLLNELNDENKQLKSEYKVLHTQYQDLKKFVENNFDEYLTQEKLNRQIIELSDENEQLRNLISIADNLMYCTTDNYRFETWNRLKKELLENE